MLQKDTEALTLVEREVIESKSYETKDELWDRVRAMLDKERFENAVSRLAEAGKIAFDGPIIIYTGIDNPKLRALAESSFSF